MHPLTRRSFVQACAATGVTTGVATLLPLPLRAGTTATVHGDPRTPADPDVVRTLALTAIDAAKAAGATYADVRITRDTAQLVTVGGTLGQGDEFQKTAYESGVQGIGVRALVNGAWGFSASPYWTVGDAARLARDAVAQARENANVMTRPVELAPTPVTTGVWSTPMRTDPFSVSLEEKVAFLQDSNRTISDAQFHQRRIGMIEGLRSTRAEKTIATTEGSFVTQHAYETTWELYGRSQRDEYVERDGFERYAPWHSYDLAIERHALHSGWDPAELRTLTTQVSEEVLNAPTKPLTHKAFDIGRYTVVVDAATMVELVGTLVMAMDLDRILGNDVNGGGTSWLGSDPVAMLGSLNIGSSLLSITANRTMPQGPATVQWDDEGVATMEYPLVTHGVVQNFATTRDKAALLAPAYHRAGRSVASTAGATSASAFEQTLVGLPNLVMNPAPQAVRVEDMIGSVQRGISVTDGKVDMDFQLRQLFIRDVFAGGSATFREISNGRLGAAIGPFALSIDARELWKNLIAVGGPATRDTWPGPWNTIKSYQLSKGRPGQTFSAGVQAVPGVFTDVALIPTNKLR